MVVARDTHVVMRNVTTLAHGQSSVALPNPKHRGSIAVRVIGRVSDRVNRVHSGTIGHNRRRDVDRGNRYRGNHHWSIRNHWRRHIDDRSGGDVISRVAIVRNSMTRPPMSLSVSCYGKRCKKCQRDQPSLHRFSPLCDGHEVRHLPPQLKQPHSTTATLTRSQFALSMRCRRPLNVDSTQLKQVASHESVVTRSEMFPLRSLPTSARRHLELPPRCATAVPAVRARDQPRTTIPRPNLTPRRPSINTADTAVAEAKH